MLGRAPWVVITDPQLLRESMTGKNADAMTGRPFELADYIFSRGKNGIVGSEGEKWKTHRRFAMTTLRNLGFGRNMMEAKV